MQTTAHKAPNLVTGVLAGTWEQGIVLALPGSDYQLHLVTDGDVQPMGLARELRGRIECRVRRVDVVGAGGRLIEPVYGRPRRAHGVITATDPVANTLTVKAACPLICTLATQQNAGQFSSGQLVAFDIERGARFIPA